MIRKHTHLSKFCLLLIVVSLSVLFSNCSTPKPSTDYAVRIKPDYQAKPYTTEPVEQYFTKEPNSGKARNAATLRGMVYGIRINVFTDSLGNPVNMKKYVLFRDSLAAGDLNPRIEEIPLEYVDLMGPKIGLGENWFENYNNPLDPKAIREVRIDTVVTGPSGTVENDCNCNPPWQLELSCPCAKRELKWYFAEIRLGYANYKDRSGIGLPETGYDALFGEIATGVRFSGDKSWGIGLAYSSGVPLYNTFSGERLLRPTVMLHMRKDFGPLICCIEPFVYGQFGLSVDGLSIDLFKTVSCKDCENKINLPELDMSLPLSYGLGVGIDIPFASFLDVSLDVGCVQSDSANPAYLAVFRMHRA